MARRKVKPLERVLAAVSQGLAESDTIILTNVLSEIKITLLGLLDHEPKTNGNGEIPLEDIDK